MKNSEMKIDDTSADTIEAASQTLLLAFRESWDKYADYIGGTPSREPPSDDDVKKAAARVVTEELYKCSNRKFACAWEINAVAALPIPGEYSFPMPNQCPLIPADLPCDLSAVESYCDGDPEPDRAIEAILVESYIEWFDNAAEPKIIPGE